MVVLIYSIIVITCLGILIQDLRFREVHVGFFVILLLACLSYNWIDPALSFKDMGYSLLFIGVLVVSLFGYFTIKYRAWSNPIDRQIGMGDIVFFLAITPFFNLKDYMFFLISGLILSLLLYAIVGKRFKQRGIPLAGLLGLYLALYTICLHCLELNLSMLHV